ncbi:MAG: hypothetical protein WC055_00335 [Melioribacteraceae bacterium]
MKNINIAIVLPVSWEYLPIQFFKSWITLKKPEHSVIIPTRGRIDDMRNAAINSVLKDGSFSHILFLDTDHFHHPDTIPKLLSHNKHIVSGLSFRRSEPYDPIMFVKDYKKFKNITEWKDGELLEVDVIGAASLLVDVEVFNRMKAPYFEMNYPYMDGVISEDFAFCLKAQELGYEVYCDTSCTNDHIGTLNINKKVWEKFCGK